MADFITQQAMDTLLPALQDQQDTLEMATVSEDTFHRVIDAMIENLPQTRGEDIVQLTKALALTASLDRLSNL